MDLNLSSNHVNCTEDGGFESQISIDFNRQHIKRKESNWIWEDNEKISYNRISKSPPITISMKPDMPSIAVLYIELDICESPIIAPASMYHTLCTGVKVFIEYNKPEVATSKYFAKIKAELDFKFRCKVGNVTFKDISDYKKRSRFCLIKSEEWVKFNLFQLKIHVVLYPAFQSIPDCVDTDFTLKVEDITIPCLKILLLTQSQKIADFMKSNPKAKEMTITEYDKATVKDFLEFLSHGMIADESKYRNKSLLRMALDFKTDMLAYACQRHFDPFLNVEEIWNLLDLLNHSKMEILRPKIINGILNNWEEMSEDECFNEELINRPEILRLVSQHSLARKSWTGALNFTK